MKEDEQSMSKPEGRLVLLAKKQVGIVNGERSQKRQAPVQLDKIYPESTVILPGQPGFV